MDKQKLVVLTSKYPYNIGEEFLEAELLHVNGKYDIFVYSVDVLPNTIHSCKDIPNYIRPKTLFKKRISLFDKILLSIYSLMSYDCIFAFKEMWLKGKFSIKNIKKTFGFMASGNRIYKQLLRELKQNKCVPQNTILYSYWSANTLYALVKMKKRYGYRIISRAHDGDVIEQALTDYYQPLRSLLFSNIDRCFAVSRAMEEYIHNNLCSTTPISISRIGTKDYGVQKYSVRNKRVFTIVTCAMISPIKRIEMIVDSLKEIKTEKIKWIHFGGGGIEYDNICKSISLLPPNICVEMMGTVNHEQIMDFYSKNQVDLFINCSSTEGIPVSVMEAMSFSIPVVATNVGGTKEIVNDSCGILLPKDIDKNILLKSIKYFYYMDDKEYIGYRENARQQWMRYCNAENNYNKMYTLIDSLFNA